MSLSNETVETTTSTSVDLTFCEQIEKEYIDLSNELFNTSFELNKYIDDISPNSALDRNSIGINTSQSVGDNIKIDANLKYILEDQSGNPRLSDGPGNANWIINHTAPSVNVDWGKGPNGDGRNDDLSEFQMTPSIYIQNPWFAQNYYVNDSEKERFSSKK